MLLPTTGNKVLRSTHRIRLQGTQAFNLLTTLPVLSNAKKRVQVNRVTTQ